MRFVLTDGSVVHLAHHTPVEWADRLYEFLVERLGCSPEYATQAVARYRP